MFGPPTIGEGIGAVGSVVERGTRKDIIPTEVEKLLGPEYLKRIEEIYGSPEVAIPREDSNFVEQLVTRLVGRPPSESEVAAEQVASKRGGDVDFFSRYLLEKLGGKVPTLDEMTGAAPEGATPAERALLAKYPYAPATDKTTEFVELEQYGRTPLRDPKAFKELTNRANEAIRWFSELPKGVDSKTGEEYSVAEDLIGEILLTDINARYGTENKRYTLEDLDLKMEKGTAGSRLTFMHPDGEGRQSIDPVTLGWSDVIDQLPGAYVILADVLGSIGGGAVGAKAGPVGIFAGATAGGATSAMVSKFLVMDKALRMGEFTYDNSKGGWVSMKSGQEQIIPLKSIFDDVVTEGMWSAGGAVLGSSIYRVGRALFTRGGAEAEYFVKKEDWDDAYRRWGENKFGKQFEAEGIPSSPAYILESGARELREAAANTTGKEADDLTTRAARMEASAGQFRSMEAKMIPEAGVARERMAGRLEEATRTVDGQVIKPANYDDADVFGRQVEAAIRSGDGAEINRLLQSMDLANQKLIDDWQLAFRGAGDQTEADFGRNIRQAAQKVLGTDKGLSPSQTKTGIYGTLNQVRNAGAIYNRRKAWNLQRVSNFVEKEIRSLGSAFKGDAGAFPSEIQGTLLRLRQAAAGKDGILPANYAEVRQLSDLVTEAAGKATGENQRRLFRLQEMLKKEEGRGLKQITGNGPLYKEWIKAQENLRTFQTTWRSEFENGLTELNVKELADRFLKGMNDDTTINSILGQFRQMDLYGREQEDLLRNVLKSRLQSVLTRGVRESDEIDIAGKRVAVRIGDQRFGTETVSGAKFAQFQDEYGPWIKQLFPDDPNLEKYAEKVARGNVLTSRYKEIAQMEKELKDLPFLRKFKATDLQQLAIDEPHKLYDLIWQSGADSVQNTASLKKLNGILKRGLTREDYNFAQQRLKALTLKKIWNPDKTFAAAGAGQADPSAVTKSSMEFLDTERSALIEVFGEKHFKNLRTLFTEMDAVASPRQSGISGLAERTPTMREVLKGGDGFWVDLKKIPGMVAKVWVGVLNRKARALNLGTKYYKEGDQRRFYRLLSDPKALDRALKIRGSVKGRIAANALGSVLFGSDAGVVRDDEIDELLENYTVLDDKGVRQAVPYHSQGEAVSESLDRVLNPKGYNEGGLHQVPNPLPNEVPMPSKQRRRDLNFKALEGGGLTRSEEIEKLELDKNNIIDSLQQEIEAARKRMAKGTGYGRVGKGIGELMGIEAQAPSNWATDPEVQALMEKIQEAASAFDARIDQVATAP